MKKVRTLTIVLMIVAIVTCLSAGTLAIYTSNLDNEVGTTSMAAKPFILTASSTQNQSLDLKLAPNDVRKAGGGEEVTFEVRNFDESGVAEVPIKLDFAMTASGELFKINGLDIKIIDWQNPLHESSYERNASWLKGYWVKNHKFQSANYPAIKDIILPAGVPTTYTFGIRCQWTNENQYNEEHTRAGENGLSGSLSLSVIGTQVLATQASN